MPYFTRFQWFLFYPFFKNSVFVVENFLNRDQPHCFITHPFRTHRSIKSRVPARRQGQPVGQSSKPRSILYGPIFDLEYFARTGCSAVGWIVPRRFESSMELAGFHKPGGVFRALVAILNRLYIVHPPVVFSIEKSFLLSVNFKRDCDNLNLNLEPAYWFRNCIRAVE